MTEEKDMFHSLQLTQEAQEIVFGDSGKSEVIGVGNIPISDHQSLSNVLLVDSLSYNLMSVSQLCGMGYDCLFTDVDVKILRREDSSIAFTGRLKGKLYLVVTPRLIPGSAILTPGNSLGSYIVPTDQHGSFVRTLSSLMCTRGNFPVGHPSQIAPSQARLT
jgi:hypothetical protein